MVRKVIGEGWKAYLGGLREVRRAGRAEVAMSPAGYPYAVPRPQRAPKTRGPSATGGAGERD